MRVSVNCNFLVDIFMFEINFKFSKSKLKALEIIYFIILRQMNACC